MGEEMSQQRSHDLDSLFAQFRLERDPELLAQIFERTSESLHQRARSLVADAMLAEDLVQETFLTLIEAASNYDPSRPLLPYIHGILQRKAMRALAQAGKKPQPVGDMSAVEPVCQERSEPERLGCAEIARRVLQAVRGLPSRYREVLRLFLEQSKTPTEISAILDREPGTVRVQVHRGLQMLRGSLPRSLAGALLASLCMADLRAASRLPPPATTPATTPASTSASIGKPLLVAAAALMVGATGVAWWLWEDAVPEAPGTWTSGNLDGRGVKVAAASTNPGPEQPGDTSTGTNGRRPLERLLLCLELEQSGQPLPHVGALILVAPGHDIDFQRARFVSGLDGRIVLPDLAPGHYQVVLDRGITQQITVPAQGPMRHTIPVPVAVTVRGRVVSSSGSPVAGARIWLEPRHPRYPGGQVVCRCDDDGRFELLGVKPLTRLGAIAPDGRPSPLALVNYRPAQELELVTVADVGSVRGRVLTLGGEPVKDAVVRIGSRPRQPYNYNCGFEFDAGYPTRQVRTDRVGAFAVTGLVPGKVQAVFRAPGRVTNRVEVEIQAGHSREIECRLRKGLRVRGRVTDPDLQPVSGAWVHAEGRAQHEWAAVRSGADGQFVLDGLNPDRVVLSVEAQGYRRAAPTLLPEHHSGALLDVVLVPGLRTRGRLLDTEGRPLPAGDYEVCIVTGPVRPEAPPPAHPVEASGSFTLPETPEDARYFVRSSDQQIWLEGQARRQTLRDEVLLDLRLPNGFFEKAAFTGQLAGLDASALLDAVLVVERDGWRYPQTVRLDPSNGRFRIRPLAVGSYRLRMVARTGLFPPVDLGERTLRKDRLNDIGVLTVKAGRLRYAFALTDGSEIRQLIAWVVDADGMEVPLKGNRGTLALWPGDYRLCAASRSFMTVRDRLFTVREGEDTTLDLKLAPARQQQIRFTLPPDIDPDGTTGCLRNEHGKTIELDGFRPAADRECGFASVLSPGSYVLELSQGQHRLQGRFQVPSKPSSQPLVVQLHPQ